MPETATTTRRDTGIAVGVTAAAVAAMGVDHLMGDDPGLEDPPMFLIATALSFALAAVVFGRIVPRARAAGRSPGRTGVVLGAIAVVPGISTLWLGLPFVLAGGAVALGLTQEGRGRTGSLTAAVLIGVVVLVLASTAHLGQAIAKLT